MRNTVLALALAAMLAGSSLQAEPPLVDRLPADATVYVGWAGRNLAFDGSMLGQMLNQPVMKELAGSIGGAILSALPDEQSRALAGHGLAMLSIAVQHKMALCMTDLTPAGTPPIPHAALLVDLGKDRQVFSEHLDALLAAAREKMSFGEGTVAGVTYKTFQPRPNMPVFAFGYIADTLFVTVGAEMPAKLIGLASAADSSLLNAPKFTAAYREVAGENEQYAVYVDVPAVKAMMEQAIAHAGGTSPERVDKIVNALGLGKVSSVVSAVRVVDRGMYAKTRIATPAPHQGWLMLLAGEPMTAGDLSIAPADADLVVAWKLNPSALLPEIKRVLAAIDEEAGARLAGVLAQADQQLGFSLESDLLAHMGDQWTLVSAPSLGGFLTGTAVVVQLKDQAKFAATLAKAEALARAMMAPPASADDQQDPPPTQRRRLHSPAMRTFTVGPTKITYLQVPEGPVPIAPAWAVHQGNLIIAAWPQVVAALVEGTPTGGLDADPAFQAAFKRITGRPGIVAYANLPKILGQTYSLPLVGWTVAANLLQGQGAGGRPDWLPSLPAIQKYLRPCIWAISADETGITEEAYGSGIAMIASPAGTALGVSVLLPALGRARQLARESISMANLRHIGLAVALHAGANRDLLPPSLETLVKEGYLTQSVLVSPISGKKAYVYIHLPRSDLPDASRLVLAYEDPTTHGQRTTAVLFLDGGTRMVRVHPGFWDLVKKSKEMAEKAATGQAKDASEGS